MAEGKERGLLPAGLKDVLPPDGEIEAQAVERLLGWFAGYGYERVKPPLVEFEENLLEGSGQAMATDTFRVMDPVSQRMMGVRADMTLQVARIARTRLSSAPRPLRLSYGGEVLRVKGSGLRPERQFAQVGLELIGKTTAQGDAEVVRLVADALSDAGVEALSIDLNVPTLVPALCTSLGLDTETAVTVRHALDRKDAAAVAAIGGDAGPLLGALLEAGGRAAPALDALAALTMPQECRQAADDLSAVVELVAAARPDLQLTVDAVEHRGFEYHTGVSFSVFARAERAELGRGGRYHVGDAGDGEPATGATLFMHTVLRALDATPLRPRLFVPFGIADAETAPLRVDGWATVNGLESVTDVSVEATRLGCSHFWVDGVARPLGDDG